MSLTESQRISAGMALAIAVLALLLLGWVEALPGAAHYSDVAMYLDAAHRIEAGELPHKDFFLPFGALSAALFALVKSVFPHVQPVLGAQYSILLIAAPAMLAATWRAKSGGALIWLWAGFALFALLPANFLTLPEPFLPAGADGRGIYNREAGLLLYALTSGLIFGDDRVIAGVLSGVLFILIGFVNVAALAIAAPFILLGLIAARVDWRALLITLAIGFASVVALEWGTKLVSNTISDLDLSIAQEGASAWTDAILLNFGGAVVLGAAGLALAWRVWSAPEKPDERVWLFNSGVALLLALAAALLGQSQHEGTQALAFLTPAAIKIAADDWDARGAGRVASVCAIVFLGLIAGAASYKGARLIVSAIAAEPIGAQDIGVSASAEDAAAAQAWLDLQTKSPWNEREALLFDQIDRFGAAQRLSAPAYALAAQQMVDGVEDWQGAAGKPLGSIATLDYVDPAAALLGASPMPGLPVVYDPERFDFTARAAAMEQALTQADVILAPMCGSRFASVDYAKLVAGALQGRKRSRLNACWAIFAR